jgi:Asp-tRNA(Asn)/Glu-tRNA(Gln) amidotransferase A subunit family amidase
VKGAIQLSRGKDDAMSDYDGHVEKIRLWEPSVRALVDWDEPAARARAAKVAGGPLAGWAIGVKDIIDVAGLPTRCNAPFLPAAPAKKNAPIIDMLEGLGAFVMAKTVTTTCAYFDPGPTRNPWNIKHTPGGSSSGSAAAVASGMVRLALGTQTVGSINRPASFCGIVGFKPTYGRFPTKGVFPLAPSLDTVGYMTSNAADALTTYAALTEGAISMPATRMRIGVIEDMLCDPPSDEMIQAVRAAAKRLTGADFDVHPSALPEEAAVAYLDHQDLLAYETAHEHRELFSRYGPSYTPRLKQLIEHGLRMPETRYRAVLEARQAVCEIVSGLFASCDLLLTASAPGTAPRGMATGDPRMNQFWTYAGYPTLTLPAALGPNGLPLGIQLIAPPDGEAALLTAGITAERALGFDAIPHAPGPSD